MKFSRELKVFSYLFFLTLYVTGVVLAFYSNPLERPPQFSIYLKIHGVVGTFFLVVFGYLLSFHVEPGLRGKHRIRSGKLNLILMGVLIGSIPGLYYINSESWRESFAFVHTYVGILILVPLVVHAIGRLKK
jgi:hypothetical protein